MELLMTDITMTADPSWFAQFRSNGYCLKAALVATLVTGLYLDTSVRFLGHELVRHIATPQLDMVLAIPMTYAAIVSWIV
jgi:hypothetical protein